MKTPCNSSLASRSATIAGWPHQGRKLFTLQTLPLVEGDDRYAQLHNRPIRSHAGVGPWERDKRKVVSLHITTCRLSLSLTSAAHPLPAKDTLHDGSTQVIFEALVFVAKLASLVPKPKVIFTRLNGVFASNSKHRIPVTPVRWGNGGQKVSGQDKTPDEHRTAMTWAQRLKRVLNIDVETCAHCGGPVKVIACIEDPVVIKKIRSHLLGKALSAEPVRLPECRAPPQAGLFR